MSKIIYNKFGSIRFMHEYYADEICKDFVVQPTTSTLRKLSKYGLLSRNLSNGGILLYEATDDIGTPKFPVDEELKLTFTFSLKNSLFPNFTDVTFSPESSSVYYFSNLNPAISGQEHTIVDAGISAPIPLATSILRLTKNDPTASYVTLRDINGNGFKSKFNGELDELKIDLSNYGFGTYTVQQYDSSNTPLGSSYTFYYNSDLTGEMPYGIFEVILDDTYDPTNPVTFLFNFKSRETYWRYNILKNEANPPIAVDDIKASTVSVKHEPDNPADKINFAIAGGTDPIQIHSANQVKLTEEGFDKIRLYKNSNILLSNLPNPTANKIDYSGGAWVSDIYVYVYV